MKNLNAYILLRQPIGRLAEVVYSNNGVESLLFRGGRVAAKKFLATKRTEIGWEMIPAFNQKISGNIVEI